MANPPDLPESKTAKKGGPQGDPTPGGRSARPKQKRKGDSANVFAAAEEYADLLSEDGAGVVQGLAPQASRKRTKRRKTGA
jgi:hypothetical protein